MLDRKSIYKDKVIKLFSTWYSTSLMLPTVQWDENETHVYNQTFSNYPWDITDHKCTPHLKI